MYSFEHDCVHVQELDMNSLRVTSQVMGQTVAMDYFEKEVDVILDNFRGLNDGIRSGGELNVQKTQLFQLLAKNNAILSDLITQIKLLDR